MMLTSPSPKRTWDRLQVYKENTKIKVVPCKLQVGSAIALTGRHIQSGGSEPTEHLAERWTCYPCELVRPRFARLPAHVDWERLRQLSTGAR